MKIYRSPIGRARGLGSAKSGVGHFIAQRVTAIALVPLTLWFVISIIGLIGADYQTMRAFLQAPLNATLMSLLVFAVFWHASLGLQVVIEDYVHCERLKAASLIGVKLAVYFLGAYSLISVFKVAFGG